MAARGRRGSTLQHAQTYIDQFNLNGFSINIHVADGTYAPLALSAMSGPGNVNWIGNNTTPDNCVISGLGLAKTCVVGGYCGQAHTLSGFTYVTGGTYTDDAMLGVHVFGSGSKVQISNVVWAACPGGHWAVEQGATLIQTGSEKVTGGCAGSTGGNGAHGTVTTRGQFQTPAPIPLNVGNTALSFNAGWLVCLDAFCQLLYSSITGSATVDGMRFTVIQNGVISCNGGGANYYPGSSPGTQISGGQYV